MFQFSRLRSAAGRKLTPCYASVPLIGLLVVHLTIGITVVLPYNKLFGVPFHTTLASVYGGPFVAVVSLLAVVIWNTKKPTDPLRPKGLKKFWSLLVLVSLPLICNTAAAAIHGLGRPKIEQGLLGFAPWSLLLLPALEFVRDVLPRIRSWCRA
jgi:hypothetical protein